MCGPLHLNAPTSGWSTFTGRKSSSCTQRMVMSSYPEPVRAAARLCQQPLLLPHHRPHRRLCSTHPNRSEAHSLFSAFTHSPEWCVRVLQPLHTHLSFSSPGWSEAASLRGRADGLGVRRKRLLRGNEGGERQTEPELQFVKKKDPVMGLFGHMQQYLRSYLRLSLTSPQGHQQKHALLLDVLGADLDPPTASSPA